MPERFDPTSLPPLPLQTETITVTDARSGREFSFTFGIETEENSLSILSQQEGGMRATQRYVTENVPLYAGGTLQIPMSETLCFQIARFEQAEKATGTLDLWSFREWASFAYLANGAWLDLNKQFAEVESRIQGKPEVGETTETDSESTPPPKNG